MSQKDDGSELLTGPDAGPLLSAAVEHAGGKLLNWALEHVDTHPNRSTTATYLARVKWPFEERTELLGVSARTGGLSRTDRGAEVFADGNREVAVWIYPNDPDLPGLTRVAYPMKLADLINRSKLLPEPVAGDDLELKIIGYRPRRRAVVRFRVKGRTYYVKAIRGQQFHEALARHRLLAAAGTPSPKVALTTKDNLMFLEELPGRPLAKAIFDPGDPCDPAELIEVLDSMPLSVARLERRPPWSDAVSHYSEVVSTALPEVRDDLDKVTRRIQTGLAGIPNGNEPTHGDFHEGQVHVADGRLVGILDVDTIGPGNRADDLACLIAHLSTIQRMNKDQEAKVRDLLTRWVPVFDKRVDPVELRLRAAAVVISLATGPFRGQEQFWQSTTRKMVRSAIALVNQVAA